MLGVPEPLFGGRCHSKEHLAWRVHTTCKGRLRDARGLITTHMQSVCGWSMMFVNRPFWTKDAHIEVTYGWSSFFEISRWILGAWRYVMYGSFWVCIFMERANVRTLRRKRTLWFNVCVQRMCVGKNIDAWGMAWHYLYVLLHAASILIRTPWVYHAYGPFKPWKVNDTVKYATVGRGGNHSDEMRA